MNKELNLLEILKDAPNGTKLYSPICGELEFDGIEPIQGLYPICCHKGDDCFLFTEEGKYYPYGDEAEILLFPSKGNKDWSTFKIRKQSVTERVRTFDDACKELGENHPYINEYGSIIRKVSSKDLAAYLKLRIIAAALNEGWKPQFTDKEVRYYPWFSYLTKDEYENIGREEDKRKYGKHCMLRSGESNSSYGFVNVFAYYGSASSNSNFGAQLAFKTRELAEYAGEQFFNIWVDYIWK